MGMPISGEAITGILGVGYVIICICLECGSDKSCCCCCNWKSLKTIVVTLILLWMFSFDHEWDPQPEECEQVIEGTQPGHVTARPDFLELCEDLGYDKGELMTQLSNSP